MLRAGCPVAGIACHGGRVASITVQTPAGTEEVTADYYIAALPVERLRLLISPDLRTAVAGSTLVAATSGRAEYAVPPREFASQAASLAGGGRVAVVFGPESSGLTHDELVTLFAQPHLR